MTLFSEVQLAYVKFTYHLAKDLSPSSELGRDIIASLDFMLGMTRMTHFPEVQGHIVLQLVIQACQRLNNVSQEALPTLLGDYRNADYQSISRMDAVLLALDQRVRGFQLERDYPLVLPRLAWLKARLHIEKVFKSPSDLLEALLKSAELREAVSLILDASSDCLMLKQGVLTRLHELISQFPKLFPTLQSKFPHFQSLLNDPGTTRAVALNQSL